MTTEVLIARLRKVAGYAGSGSATKTVCTEAADALEALGREVARLTESVRYEADCVAAIEAERDQARAELAAIRAQRNQQADMVEKCMVAMNKNADRGQKAEAALSATADWLWGQLMDWCRSRKVAPANYDDLFEIVRKARDASPKIGGV